MSTDDISSKIASYYASKQKYTDLLKQATDRMLDDLAKEEEEEKKNQNDSTSPPTPKTPKPMRRPDQEHPPHYIPVRDHSSTTKPPPADFNESTIEWHKIGEFAAMVKKMKDEDMKGKDKERKKAWARIDRGLSGLGGGGEGAGNTKGGVPLREKKGK